MIVTTQAGMSVECQCPQCVAKREADTPECTEKEARELWDFLTRAKYEGVLSPGSISAIWGMLPDEPVADPIAPPPINWLTHQKPLTDTVPQRAAFLKKSGLTCPTEITPDDIDIFGRVSR